MDDNATGIRSQDQSEMLQQYSAPSDVFDEMRNDAGALRPGWQQLLPSLQRTGPVELARRWEQTQRLIRENGIAFGAYLETDNMNRPWQLDALPLMISASDWQIVEEGLQQRARLLDLVLTDLYGPQRLLAEGQLPAEIVFAHPGFRRPYHGHQPLGGSFLHCYAADMARAPDGSWRVLADRSEAPSGVGFALENRVVMSRMFPSEFRECRVSRLAPFFITMRETLQRLAPKHRDNPRVVILSEGPQSANYFEDAYLARYLGYTLVEGADLAVRSDQVLLKTLGGLLPVDVIVRRSDSASCDPLELDGDSQHGVIGLLQAARAGNVAVCNAMGSGLVESPIFMAFMPRLCQFLLGEAPKLPGVETWWCGEPASLDYVLDNLDQLTVKRAFRNRLEERDITRRLRSMPRERLVAKIKENPIQFVGQPRVSRSSVPLWSGGRIETSYLALRSYLVSSPDGYRILPGGLARTSKSLDSLEVSILDGEGSKDTWVLSSTPVEQVSLLPHSDSNVTLRRSGADLPSRVADNLFWLGRHLERADAAARLLRTVTLRLTSEADLGSLVEIPSLLRALAHQGQIEPGFAVEGIRDQLPAIDVALPAAVFDRGETGSLRTVLKNTLRIAAKVRDRLSVDSWRILLRMEEQFQVPDPEKCDLTVLLNLANELILDLAAFGGTVMESTTRTQAFRFLDIGRRLERTIELIHLVENCFLDVGEIPAELLEAVLETDDSLMTYRSRYLANLQLSATLDLLLTDETNPRSLAFQLAALAQHVEALPRGQNSPHYAVEERLAMSMLHTIRMVDIVAISKLHSLGDQNPLESILKSIAKELPLLSHAISHRYLVHAGPSQQLSEIEPGAGFS